jgi:outer membrane protein
MLSLNFPLYQGGYVSDRVEEARYLALSTQKNAEDVKMNIKISLEKRIQDIKISLESIQAESIAVLASKKYFEAATASYKNGLGSLTDAYLAEASYHDNRLKLINTEANLFNALAEIYYYSGEVSNTKIQELEKKYLN